MYRSTKTSNPKGGIFLSKNKIPYIMKCMYVNNFWGKHIIDIVNESMIITNELTFHQEYPQHVANKYLF